ncbi:MAG: DUF7847 domain-containing protein [Candidatus Thorarchaeota archaeon]|jgi:hypothetical protein
MSFIDDVKTSFGIAKNNVLSFLLAIFGMLIMIVVLLAIVIVPFVLMAVYANPSDPGAVSEAISQFVNGITSVFGVDTLGGIFAGGALGLLFLIPIAAIATWMFGGIFGMSKEIIESGGTHAESAFGYLRKNFVSYFAAGVLWALVVFVPMWLIGVGVTALTGFTSVPVEWEWPIAIIAFAYFYILLGFLMLHLPAVTDGLGAVESLKTSFKLTVQNPVRVFGAWTIFVAVFAIFFGPIALYAYYAPIPGVLDLGMLITIIWAAVGAFVIFLFFLPAMFLTFTKIYLSLDGKSVPQGEVEQ